LGTFAPAQYWMRLAALNCEVAKAACSLRRPPHPLPESAERPAKDQQKVSNSARSIIATCHIGNLCQRVPPLT